MISTTGLGEGVGEGKGEEGKEGGNWDAYSYSGGAILTLRYSTIVLTL